MKALKELLCAILLAVAAASTANAQIMIEKGSFAAGAHFGHAGISSDNSELLMMLNPINASGSISFVAPFFEYAYRDDRSVGVKFQYLGGNAVLDDLTLALPGEGMTFTLSDMSTYMRRYSAFAYHRNYFALDKRSRIGLIAEESLSYSFSRSFSDKENPDRKYTTSSRINLAFSPGLIFFVMNNISASFTLSIANMSYNTAKCYSDGMVTGARSKFDARLGIDITGINFGIGFHF